MLGLERPLDADAEVLRLLACANGPCPALVDGRLPSNEPTCYEFYPRVATVSSGPNPGLVGWAWYDTGDDPTNSRLDVRGSVMDNLFYCFPSSQCYQYPIATGTNVPWSTPTFSTGSNLAYGDYDGIAGDATDGSFHVAWADLRNQASTAFQEQVFTAQLFGP